MNSWRVLLHTSSLLTSNIRRASNAVYIPPPWTERVWQGWKHYRQPCSPTTQHLFNRHTFTHSFEQARRVVDRRMEWQCIHRRGEKYFLMSSLFCSRGRGKVGEVVVGSRAVVPLAIANWISDNCFPHRLKW